MKFKKKAYLYTQIRHFKLSIPVNVQHVQIFDFLGNKALVYAHQNTIDITNLMPGFYSVICKTEGVYKSGKFIKMN